MSRALHLIQARSSAARAIAAGALVLGLAGCGLGLLPRGGYDELEPEPEWDLTLSVKNQNFHDTRLYAVAAGHRVLLGTVPSYGEQTFTFRWPHLDLSVEIHFLAAGSVLTHSLPVGGGDELELIITPDAHRRARP